MATRSSRQRLDFGVNDGQSNRLWIREPSDSIETTGRDENEGSLGTKSWTATRVVTPTVETPSNASTQVAIAPDIDSRKGRRRLFQGKRKHDSVAESKATNAPTTKARRKLAFGRHQSTLEFQPNVRHVYKIVKKLTGSIGGNGSFGAIYGELTMGSMQKMVNLMKEHTDFNDQSRFIDVGSGLGKPNIHVAQDPGVVFSYGIEMEYSRWLLSMSNLRAVLDAGQCQPENIDKSVRIGHRCIFEHKNIFSAKSFDPFTHVYMFSIG